MPITPIAPLSNFENFMRNHVERCERAIIYNLGYIGERCVNEARNSGSYRDQTGNLRGSIGYVIVQDGKVIVMSNFVSKNGKGQEGSKEGGDFAKQIVQNFPTGIVLIVVAGMRYASYVAAKGFNVLDSSELLAIQQVPKIMKSLGFVLK